jgi:hypothetical protein
MTDLTFTLDRAQNYIRVLFFQQQIEHVVTACDEEMQRPSATHQYISS